MTKLCRFVRATLPSVLALWLTQCALFTEAVTEVPLPVQEACNAAYEAVFEALDRGYPLQTYVDHYGQTAVTCALVKFVEKYRTNPQFRHAVDRAVQELNAR